MWKSTVAPFIKKFWPLFMGLLVVAGFGLWYRFVGPGDFNSRSLKAYNTVWASVLELRRDPDNFDAALTAGIGYYNLTRLNKAEEYYQIALNLKPDSGLVWNNLGNTYREMLRLEEAENAYQQSMRVTPTSPTPYLNLINLYTIWPVEEIDRRPRIPTILLQALSATNRSEPILRELVTYYRGIGDEASAVRYETELTRRADDDPNPPKPA